ncbi:EAL domain-containing protein [Xanthobacteraceae bacterium A53D]
MIGRITKPLAASEPSDADNPPLDTAAQMLDALSAALCAVYVWDLATDRISWSPNAGDLLGREALERLQTGRGFLEVAGLSATEPSHHGFNPIATDTPAAGGAEIPRREAPKQEEPAREGSGYLAALRLSLSPDAEPRWAIEQGRWFRTADGRPDRAVGTLQFLPHSMSRLSASAFDPLTGLPSRRHLSHVLATLPHGPEARWAMMLVGLDNLGRINDRFGFEAADRVLTALADHLRSTSAPGDALIRFSGNKFAIVLMNRDGRDLVTVGEALIEDIRHTLLPLGDGQIPVSATIGAIAAPLNREHPDKIVARLQQAHEFAKRRGRGRFYLDASTDREEARRRTNLQMADEIVRAVELDQITVAYQPVVRASDRSLAFNEALARIAPSAPGHRYSGHRLVAAAEPLGLMGGLDRRVLEKVTAAMRRDPDLRLSVNVSASSISDDAWLRIFDREVSAHIGERLILELTETVAVDHLPAARKFIQHVRTRGCRIAIDDFGAGATSFKNLRKLDVDLVKIDGGFVRNMLESEDDQTFVKALLTLARQLGIETVAEWVQNETVAGMLQAWGCNYLQGSLSGLARIATPPSEE